MPCLTTMGTDFCSSGMVGGRSRQRPILGGRRVLPGQRRPVPAGRRWTCKLCESTSRGGGAVELQLGVGEADVKGAGERLRETF